MQFSVATALLFQLGCCMQHLNWYTPVMCTTVWNCATCTDLRRAKKKKMYFAPERALEILNSLPTYAPVCCIILSNLLFLGMPQFLMWNSFITLIGEVCYPTFHLLSRHTNEQENPHIILTWQSVGLEIKLIARSILKHGLIEVKVCCCLI